MENMVKYEFDLETIACKITMEEFDDVAQIFVDGELIAEYAFGGAGCTKIYHADNKKLIETLVCVLYDQKNIES